MNIKIAVGLLIALAVIWRWATDLFEFLPNATPLMAMAVLVGMSLGRKWWWVAVAALLLSQAVVALNGTPFSWQWTLLSLVMYVAVLLLVARREPGRPDWTPVLGATVLGSTGFYLVGNTVAWVQSAGYPMTLAGWWQAQTVGLPGFPPSLFFLRNMLLADTVFIVLAMGVIALVVRRPAGDRRPAVPGAESAASPVGKA